MIEGLRIVFLTESLKMSDLEERKKERLERKVEGKEGKKERHKWQRE